MIKGLKDFVLTWFTRAMTEDNVNSRMVFLLQGLGATIGVGILTVAFLFVHDRAAFPTMIGTLMGGGALAAVGRAATKYTGS
jgi:hypothetical protein